MYSGDGGCCCFVVDLDLRGLILASSVNKVSLDVFPRNAVASGSQRSEAGTERGYHAHWLERREENRVCHRASSIRVRDWNCERGRRKDTGTYQDHASTG